MSALLLTGCPPYIESSLLNAISQTFSDHERILLCGLEPLQIFDLPDFCTWIEAPRNTCPDYRRWMEDICLSYNVAEIIPLIDSEVEFFWSQIDSDGFLNNVFVWVSPSSKIDLVVNKKSAYEHCPPHFCPINFSITKPDEIQPALSRFLPGADFVSRPISGVNGSGKGVRFVLKNGSLIKSFFCDVSPSSTINLDDYIRICSEAYAAGSLPPQLITEFLPGAEYSCYVVCDRGVLRDIAVHRKLKNQEGSTSSGEAVIVTHVAAVEICREIVSVFNLDLLNNIQVREDAYGKLKLVEINPRVAGSINLSEEFQYQLLLQTRAIASARLGERYPCVAWDHDSKPSRRVGSIIRQASPRFLSMADLDPRCLIRAKMEEGGGTAARVQYASFSALIEGIETVIFDMDNTLYDEFSFITVAAKRLLLEHTALGTSCVDHALVRLESYYRRFGNNLLFDNELAQYFTDNVKPAMLTMFLSLLREGDPLCLELPPVSHSFLTECKAQQLNMFCVTDGNPAQQRRKFDSLHLSRYFDERQTIYADIFGGKRDQRCARMLRGKFPTSLIDPQKVLVIGDGIADEQLAQSLECWFFKYSVNKP